MGKLADRASLLVPVIAAPIGTGKLSLARGTHRLTCNGALSMKGSFPSSVHVPRRKILSFRFSGRTVPSLNCWAPGLVAVHRFGVSRPAGRPICPFVPASGERRASIRVRAHNLSDPRRSPWDPHGPTGARLTSIEKKIRKLRISLGAFAGSIVLTYRVQQNFWGGADGRAGGDNRSAGGRGDLSST